MGIRLVVMLGLVAVGMLLGGCNQYGYRYKPDVQPDETTPVYADFKVNGERVDIFVDTGGRRLKSAEILMGEGGDGRRVLPVGIDWPEFVPELIGGMSSAHDPRYGADKPAGPTVLHFEKQAIGEGPWRVEMEMGGMGRVEVVVGKK